MATAEVAALPRQDRPKRKPLAQLFKNWASRKNKSSDEPEKSSSKKNTPMGSKNTPMGSKNKRHFGYNGTLRNNPYPQSGQQLQHRQSLDSNLNDNLSMSVASRRRDGEGSFDSDRHERDAPAHSNQSGAPTLATNAGTIHSDAGNSKAATTTTHGGALSSLDGANPDSNFSSPRNSIHSLTTTLTTIHSTGTTLQTTSAGHPNPNHHGLNSANPAVMFSHQYPVSPAPSSTGTHISAIPRHIIDGHPTAASANLLTDNASILTLASSSKRRRRSMDTDASVRALAPSSAYGGSRESLPLSVLSGNADRGGDAVSTSGVHFSQSRPSIGGIASAERASVYSMQGGGGGTVTSERNSYYSYRPNKDLGDAKSVRSITGVDSRSLAGDARSINADAKSVGGGDARSLAGGDVSSLKATRGDDGSILSGAVGHSRNGSIPGSIGAHSLIAQSSHQNRLGALSRRSSDWAETDGEGERKGSLDEQEESAEAKFEGA